MGVKIAICLLQGFITVPSPFLRSPASLKEWERSFPASWEFVKYLERMFGYRLKTTGVDSPGWPVPTAHPSQV